MALESDDAVGALFSMPLRRGVAEGSAGGASEGASDGDSDGEADGESEGETEGEEEGFLRPYWIARTMLSLTNKP